MSLIEILNKHIKLSERHLKTWEDHEREFPGDRPALQSIVTLNRDLNIMAVMADMIAEIDNLKNRVSVLERQTKGENQKV